MEDSDYLKSKQKYVIKKVNSIMKHYPSKKYEVRFRNGKVKTAGTVLQDTKTHFTTFVFSNYLIQAFYPYELDNLIKHECAHVISDDTHGEKFKKICKKLKCSKKWQQKNIDKIDVYSNMIDY
jgi:predicted metal-dependent hydrolase